MNLDKGTRRTVKGGCLSKTDRWKEAASLFHGSDALAKVHTLTQWLAQTGFGYLFVKTEEGSVGSGSDRSGCRLYVQVIPVWLVEAR